MGFRLKSGNTSSFKLMGGTEKSPAKQKYTVIDARPQDVIDKEKEVIKKEEEAKKKDQERIQQQIEGTYVETEEDVKEWKEEMKKNSPRPKPKKSPAKQYENPSDRKRETPGQYWYIINNRPATKAEYVKYQNKPGGDEPGKQTNDPDVYGRNKTK